MQKITILCSEEEACPIGIYLMSKRIEFSAEYVEENLQQPTTGQGQNVENVWVDVS